MTQSANIAKLVRMEKINREVGALIGEAIKQSGGGYGFALFMFSFDEEPEMTWISKCAACRHDSRVERVHCQGRVRRRR